jgi:hypothetical protein
LDLERAGTVGFVVELLFEGERGDKPGEEAVRRGDGLGTLREGVGEEAGDCAAGGGGVEDEGGVVDEND